MEPSAYRDNLADILDFTGGRRLLSVGEVGRYTGLRDPRTIRRRFPRFQGRYISAPALARCLSGEEGGPPSGGAAPPPAGDGGGRGSRRAGRV